MQKGMFSEMVLLDANHPKAEGEAMDISHGLPFAHAMDIYAGTYEDIADASVVIITAGANQKPGETRLDLVHKNAKIMKMIISEIKRVKCEGILLIVSNPVDILTQVAAASAALNAFTRELLANHIRTCVAQDIRSGKDETIDELVATLQKLMK